MPCHQPVPRRGYNAERTKLANPHIKLGINHNCARCGKSYYVSPSRIGKSKYCCKACFTVERRELACKRCGVKFIAVQDHGKWPVYCSRACSDGDAPQPIEKVCPSCSSTFLAKRSSHKTPDGLRIYCSDKCRNEGLRKINERTCERCGVVYILSDSRVEQRANRFCSNKCSAAFSRGENNPQWKGGKYIDTGTGHRRNICRREGFSSPYLAEHRVIAAAAIGRYLKPTEMMLHLNDRPADNRPENLFICASPSELRKRRNGSLPWPKESNLSTYGKS